MRNEIKRATELWLVARLAEATGLRFAVNKGGADPGGTAEALLPPVGLVQVTTMESALYGGVLWQVTAVVGYMSHLGEATAPEHSAAVRKIEDAIRCLPEGLYPALGVRVDGTSLHAVDDFTDTEEKVFGDAFTLRLGVAQMAG